MNTNTEYKVTQVNKIKDKIKIKIGVTVEPEITSLTVLSHIAKCLHVVT